MASIGVRALRQRASELLRRVAQGETIEVTDRGRRVAILSPPPEGGPLERLRALGEVERASGDLDDLPAPMFSRGGSSAHPMCSAGCGSTSAEPWPRISTRQPS